MPRLPRALGQWLAVGLEFELAADILRTAVTPTWNNIEQLIAIAALRTGLNYFLEREIDGNLARWRLEPARCETILQVLNHERISITRSAALLRHPTSKRRFYGLRLTAMACSCYLISLGHANPRRSPFSYGSLMWRPAGVMGQPLGYVVRPSLLT